MKKITAISRILLGFLYLVFGLDYFLHFIPYQPNHTGKVAAFKSALVNVGYFYPMIKSIQVVGGLSLMFNRYAPFFAVVLFPISVNVLLYHTILVPIRVVDGCFPDCTEPFFGICVSKVL